MDLNYSREQEEFYYLKRELNKVLEEMEELKKRKDEPGVKEKLDELEEYRQRLCLSMWVRIKKYAKSEITRMSRDYGATFEQMNDMEQSLCAIFFEKLPQYDPLQSTPTTYFKRYFRQEISGYLRQYHAKMTQYDAANVRKLRKAIDHFKENEMDYNYEMLSQRTGLSILVVKRTLQIADNVKYPASVA